MSSSHNSSLLYPIVQLQPAVKATWCTPQCGSNITLLIALSMALYFIHTGWAVAETLTRRLLPLWVGAGAMEFSWNYVLDSITSNAELVSAMIR